MVERRYSPNMVYCYIVKWNIVINTGSLLVEEEEEEEEEE